VPGGTTEGLAGQNVGGHQSYFPAWDYLVLAALGNKNPNEYQLRALNILANAEGVPYDTYNWLDLESEYSGQWATPGEAPSLRVYPGNPNWQEGKDPIAYGIWSRPDGANSPVVINNYPSQSVGISALVKFLDANHPNIVEVLTADNPTGQEVFNGFMKDGAWGTLTGSYKGDSQALEDGLVNNKYTPSNNGGPMSTSLTGAVSASQNALPGSGGYGCGSKGAIISWPSFLDGGTIFSYCEAKALVGGFLTALGIVIMAGGITILIKNSSDRFDLSGLAETVAKPAKSLPKVLQNRTSTPTGTVPTPKPTAAPKAPKKAPTPSKAQQRVIDRDKQLKDAEREIADFRAKQKERYPQLGNKPRPTATTKPKPSTPRVMVPPPVEKRVPRKEKKLRSKP